MRQPGQIDKIDGPSMRAGFVRSAAMFPERPALSLAGVEYSYADLDRTARVWAAAIVDRLGRPAQRVGVFAYRSRPAYNGVLAALFSGATFVPLNSTFPVERTRAMAAAADLDAIIVDAGALKQLPEVLSGIADRVVLVLPEPGSKLDLNAPQPVVDFEAVAKVESLEALPPILPDDVAYILFTSGSTGTPKGVPVTHGNVQHFMNYVVRRYGLDADDRFSQTFDQTFDLSVFDLFAAWEVGGCVCGMQPIDLLAPARFVNRNRVTIWFSVPSVPVLMQKRNGLSSGLMPNLRWSLFCGEPLPVGTAEAWRQAAPNSIVENLYGPTELTLACLLHRWDPVASQPSVVNDLVPIGRPFDGLGALVVDEKLQPVSDGESGELCVCGPQTCPGYWRDPAKTAERFFEYTPPGSSAYRFYRTGDRVTQLPTGEYAFLGRTDHQVKVRGYRVELGEIEAVLRRSAGINHAAAIAWPVVDGSAEGIVAFVSGANVQSAELEGLARSSLPAYMVPSAILPLEEMPLNANGKIDRKALTKLAEQKLAPRA